MPGDNAYMADDMRRLRARFPRWGIVFDPLESMWVAVRGKRTLVAASSPEKLTEQVEAATRGEAGPGEGDKTQRWRALRRHEGASGPTALRSLLDLRSLLEQSDVAGRSVFLDILAASGTVAG